MYFYVYNVAWFISFFGGENFTFYEDKENPFGLPDGL